MKTVYHYKNNDTAVGGIAEIADRITEGQPDGKKESMEPMAAPCLKIQYTTMISLTRQRWSTSFILNLMPKNRLEECQEFGNTLFEPIYYL